jgi:hypothetical protein
MAGTLATKRKSFSFIERLAKLEEIVQGIRSNQVQKLILADTLIIDGTGSTGKITFLDTDGVYLQARSGGGVDFYRLSDNTKIASLDKNGNLKTLGTITPSTTP